MKRLMLTGVVIVMVAGCATQPVQRAAPFFYNGKYYMAGDESCVNVSQAAATKVVCMTAEGQATGYRDAMTDQQLTMYQHNQMLAQQRAAQAAAERAALSQQMQQTSYAIQQSTPQYAPMQAPVVAPITMPGNNAIHCLSVSDGFYTTCRF